MVYDANGAHPDPKMVEDIKMLPAPTCEAKLQDFLGIAIYMYMGSFMPHLLQLTAPLRDILKKDIDFQ